MVHGDGTRLLTGPPDGLDFDYPGTSIVIDVMRKRRSR